MKETLPTNVIKGQTHKEIVRTSVTKNVVRNSKVHPELVRSSVLRTTVRQGPARAELHASADVSSTTTINQTVDLGTTNLGTFETNTIGVEGGDNEGTVGYGTSVIEGANATAFQTTTTTESAGFGIEGGDNAGTVGYGTSMIQGATTTEQAGFGIEGGDNAGTVGYGTSMIQGATSSVVGLPTAATNTLTSTISTNYLPGPYISSVEETA